MRTDGRLPFLRADGLWRRFAGQPEREAALRGASLTLERGGTALLAGPSGSGKTTFLHILAGLDRPDAGTVTVDGEEATALGESALAAWRGRAVGIVFQHHLLPPGLRARDCVAEPLLWSRNLPPSEALREADRWLERAGLAGFAHQKVESLSGGQRQRVAIARALAGRPTLLLADEPTGHLDVRAGAAAAALLREAAADVGAALVVVTHEADAYEWGPAARFRFSEGRIEPA